MAVFNIRTRHDPILRRKAKRIKDISEDVHKLIDDMVDTMRAASGVGLAAPQVGHSLRLAVIQIQDGELIVLINPEIVKRGGERCITEACLSVPGYYGEVTRSIWVKVKALDRYGKEFRLKGDGILAQALEHEIDHLNGILYLDRLPSPEMLQKVTPSAEVGGAGGINVQK
jgi:peptide deformylase